MRTESELGRWPQKRKNMKYTISAIIIGLTFAFSTTAFSEELSAGSGCGDLKLGMSESEAISKVGTPKSSWIKWEDKHIDCLVMNGEVREIRINKGSTATFDNGVGMKSDPQKIKSIYGEPTVTKPKPNVEKWEYSNIGILFWILDGKTINQIVLFKPYKK